MKAFCILLGLMAHITVSAVESTHYEKMANYVACKAIEIDLWEKGMTLNCKCLAASPPSYQGLQKCIRDAKVAATSVSDTGPIQEFLEQEKANKEKALKYAEAINAQAKRLKASSVEYTMAGFVHALLKNDPTLKGFLRARKKTNPMRPLCKAPSKVSNWPIMSPTPI